MTRPAVEDLKAVHEKLQDKHGMVELSVLSMLLKTSKFAMKQSVQVFKYKMF